VLFVLNTLGTKIWPRVTVLLLSKIEGENRRMGVEVGNVLGDLLGEVL
jgi:hypothetical protein